MNKLSRVVMLAMLLPMTLAVLAGASTALAEEEPSGTVVIEDEQLRFIVGGALGTVTLHYQGEEYPFEVSGLTLGGFGFSEVHAKGDVYNLKDPADLAGNYSAAQAGVTVGVGKGAVVVENEKGVVIELTSTSEGAELGLGVGGLVVQPKN